MQISINISDHPLVPSIKRRVVVQEHHKSYSGEVYTVPYTIQHYNEGYYDHLSFIPDLIDVLRAENSKIVWVKADGTFSEEEEPETTPMGMYSYFEMLQKNISDIAIITGQILLLDSKGKFDVYNS